MIEIPKEIEENLELRHFLLDKAKKDRTLQRALWLRCKHDILFFVNVFTFQFNPKKKGREAVGPFITWSFQDRMLLDRPETTGRKGILWYYENDRTCVVEKSREMGASWIFLIFQVWLCLFHDYVQVLDISRSADAVDSKSRNSLFAKIRFIHEHLPEWMTGTILHTNMYFEYKRTNSEITGEASTGRSGSGGRATVQFIDEFQEIKEDVKVRQNTASIGDCRFFNGTHLGTGTEFYELTTNKEIGKIVVHWTRHPDKNKGLYSYDVENHKQRFWKYDEATDKIVERPGPDIQYDPDFQFVQDGVPVGGPHPGIRSPWYDAKCVDIGNRHGVAMELDIDPKGAAKQFFDALLIDALKRKYAQRPWWEGDLLYDQDGYPKGLVKADGGPLRLWLRLDDNGRPPQFPYGTGADIATGLGATPSTLSMGNCITGEKVVEYSNAHIDEKEFGIFAVALCRWFVDKNGIGAKLCWERNGSCGVTFGNKVVELGYSNFYLHRPERGDKLKAAASESPGWLNNSKNKKVLLLEYSLALRDGHCLNPSERALDECLQIKYDNRGEIVHSRESTGDEAARENHADLVMSDAQMNKMMQEVGQLASVVKKQEEKEKSSYPDPRTQAGRVKLAEMEEELEESWA